MISKILPKNILIKNENKEIIKIGTNVSWLLAEKALRTIVGLLVMVWFARYLGPEKYGIYNYAIAFVSIFSAISAMGLDSIVVRDLVRQPEIKDDLLGTVFVLRLAGAFFAVFLAVAAVLFFRPGDTLICWLVGILSAGMLFQAFDVIDFWFKSQVQSKYTVYAKTSAFLVASAVKISLIVLKAPLIAFVWTALVEVVLGAVGLILFYHLMGWSIGTWKNHLDVAKKLLSQSWPLFLGYLSYLVYMRVDQIMIGNMLDDYSVGIYSVSTRLLEIPISIITIVTMSFFPFFTKLFEEDKINFYKKYENITFAFTVFGFIVLALVYFFGEFFVLKFFGNDYLDTYQILTIQIIGFIFMANAVLRSSYLTISNNQKIILITTVISAGMNIFLNYLFIPNLRTSGAAMATVLTQLFSLFLLNIFFKGTRKIFLIQLRSLLLFPCLGFSRKGG